MTHVKSPKGPTISYLSTFLSTATEIKIDHRITVTYQFLATSNTCQSFTTWSNHSQVVERLVTKALAIQEILK